ncbi:MAG: hypothetical protein HRT40_00160 [Campylobacteraceae bacterium]|nr:hypothetical protein [Campylobacteraceae bacterium]
MNKKILIATVILPIVLFANKPAIEKLNYDMSSNYNTSNSGERINVRGSVRIPVINYVGIGLNTEFSKFYGKNNYSDSDNKSAGIRLIFRDSSIGKIETAYQYIFTNFDSEFFSLNSKSKQLSINATYYFKDFDFLVHHSQSKITYDTYNSYDGKGTSSSTSYNTNMNMAYYINNNLRISTGKNSNTSYKANLSISYQLKILDNLVTLSTSYNKVNKSYIFGLKYTFNTKVNLKDRIRKY